MLSIENQPGHICSYKASALKSDEREPDKLAFSEADPIGLGQEQPPHFSIRDFVFTSRSKDIETNWPFPQKHLQLCLMHGVKNLLPPFEPPNLVRAKYSGKSDRSEQQISCLEGERTPVEIGLVERRAAASLSGESDAINYELCSLSEQSVLGSSELAQITSPGEVKCTANREGNSDDELTHREAVIESTVTIDDRLERFPSSISTFPHPIQESKVVSEESSEIGVAKIAAFSEKVKTLHESSQKRCRLIVKLGTVSEPNRTEDIASNSSMVSDSMASKVCPVCKTFSSTSNTTLNAHIDQCLSVESNTKRAVTELSKHKVKLRMKRSMVDIYATAHRCTLEDLDRRNGTNWSIDLSLIAPRNDTCNEIKRPKLSPVTPTDDGSEGEVYVDSNGTKLRILSKFSAAASLEAAGEKFKHWSHAKEIKEEKRSSFGKKKYMSPEYGKYMKVKLQSKKLSSFKSLKGEIQRTSEEKFQVGTHQEKKERISLVLNPHDQTKSCGSGTLGQWVVSKRSDLPKTFNSKVNYRSPRNLVEFNPNSLSESNQPQSGNLSVVRSHVLKLSKPPGDFASSPKTKSMDILSNKANTTDFKEKPSPVSREIHCRILPEKNFSHSMCNTSSTVSGLKLKLSQSSENHMTRKSNDFLHMTPKTSEKLHLRKARRKSTRQTAILRRPSYTLEASKNEVEKHVVSKKFQKHVYREEACIPGREVASDTIDHLCGSTRDSDLGSVSGIQTNKAYLSHFSNNFMRQESEDVNEKVSPSQRTILESKEERDSTSILEREKYSALKQLQQGAEFQELEIANGDVQVEASSNVDTVMISGEKAVGISATSETVTSEDHVAALNDKLHLDPCLLEQVKLTGGTEAIEPSGPQLYEDALIYRGDEVNNKVICPNILIEGQVESTGKGNTCSDFQYMECQTDTASIQGSSACLTGPGDTGLDLPQENSSVTSVRIVPPQDDYMEIVRGSSESPVSVASTVSHSHPEDIKFKDLEPEPSTRAVVVQDKPTSDFCHNWALPFMSSLDGTEKTGIERGNQEVKTIALGEEHGNSQDAQTYCCSRGEGLSREYIQSGQSIMGEPTLPIKKMTPNLYTRRAGSTFGTYPSLRTEQMMRPILESHLDCLSTKTSSNSAGRNPTCSDFGSASPPWTRPQSSPSPILRLMGKNLMVMSKDNDESVPPQKVAPCSSSANPQNTKYLSLQGFSRGGNLSNEGGFPYHHHQFPEGPLMAQQIPHPPPTMTRIGGFIGPTTQNGLMTKTDWQDDQKKSNPKAIYISSVENVGRLHHRQKSMPNTPREVIVIDDSPELEIGPQASQPSNMPPTVLGSNISTIVRQISYFPPQNSLPLRELPGETRPALPISCPRTDFHTAKKGFSSEDMGVIFPSPFMVPAFSAGHLRPKFYYNTPSLR